MWPDYLIAELFAIVFLHVFPQCGVGIQVGHASIYTGNESQVSSEILYRTIDRVGDRRTGWTESDELPERDLALEQRILAFRSRRYPQTKIFHAECLRRRR